MMIPERKDKIEDSNRSLIQEFQSQLLTQLEVLNSSVAGSVTQQEKQLQDMEKVMASFVSAKTEVKHENKLFSRTSLSVISILK